MELCHKKINPQSITHTGHERLGLVAAAAAAAIEAITPRLAPATVAALRLF